MDSLSSSAAVREALQLRILLELMSGAVSKELVLKGGLALRMVHGSTRYTRDIDLDADAKFSRERIQGIARRAIARSLASGLVERAMVSEPKQTDTTLRWKVSGVMPGGGAPLHLTVEISRRPHIVPTAVVEVKLGGGASPAVYVRALDRRTIAATKVLALTDPQRFAVRDLYDLHVLIDAEIEGPVEQLAAVVDGKGRLELALKELWPKIEAMTWDDFRDQVIPFLPGEPALAIEESGFEELRVKVGTRVEGWLKQAAQTAGSSDEEAP